MAVGNDLAVAGHHVPEHRIGIVARIAERAAQFHPTAFVDGLVLAGIHGRAAVEHGHHYGVAAHSAIIIAHRHRHGVHAVIHGNKAHVLARAVGNHLPVAGRHVPKEAVRVGQTWIADQGAQIDR